MKKLLIVVVGVGLSFTVGLAATYFAAPVVAPELIREIEPLQDSLAADGTPLAVPGDSLVAQGGPGAYAVPDQAALVTALRDSLALLDQQLRKSGARERLLAEQIGALQQQQQALAAQRASAADLGSTLAKLEEKERRALVARLDAEALRAIYAEASSRNRTLLLQAMTPDRAARFVGRLMQPARPSISQARTSDD